MSGVQPPGRPEPFGTPCAAKTPGAGHVVADGGMNLSMLNGALVKLLLMVAPPEVESVHVTGCGGDARVTSFWSRHGDATPPSVIWTGCPAVAAARPLTPSPPPDMVSTRWVSS